MCAIINQDNFSTLWLREGRGEDAEEKASPSMLLYFLKLNAWLGIEFLSKAIFLQFLPLNK